MAATAQRVAKEVKRLTKHPPPGISAWPASDASATRLEVQMQGPPGTPYEQGLFRLQVCVPPRYPMEPAKVTFVTPVYHPNIDGQGRICLDILSMPPKGTWSPALDLAKVLMAVRQLLAEPNPSDPLVVDIAAEYASQPELFRVKAQQHTCLHARPSQDAGQQQEQQQVDAAACSTPAASAAAPGGGVDNKENAGGQQQQTQQGEQQQQQREKDKEGHKQQAMQQEQQQQQGTPPGKQQLLSS